MRLRGCKPLRASEEPHARGRSLLPRRERDTTRSTRQTKAKAVSVIVYVRALDHTPQVFRQSDAPCSDSWQQTLSCPCRFLPEYFRCSDGGTVHRHTHSTVPTPRDPIRDKSASLDRSIHTQSVLGNGPRHASGGRHLGLSIHIQLQSCARFAKARPFRCRGTSIRPYTVARLHGCAGDRSTEFPFQYCNTPPARPLARQSRSQGSSP